MGWGFGIVIKNQKQPIKLTSPSPELVDLHINQRQQSNPHWRAAISDCLLACTVSLASSHTHTNTDTSSDLHDVMNLQGFLFFSPHSRMFFFSSALLTHIQRGSF